MKKTLLSVALISAALVSSHVSASEPGSVGVGVNYGLLSGPTLELTYPINNVFQLRGALSSGMSLNKTTSDTDIDYDLKADGGINRLAIDYHPFSGNFFLSGGYAVNSFKLSALGSTGSGQDITIGKDDYKTTSDLRLNGALDWDSGATLSFGWGHSPAEGWGAIFEVGAIFTGAAKVSLSSTGSVTDVNGNSVSSADFQDSINAEKKKLQDDVADLKILPILQAGITYRF